MKIANLIETIKQGAEPNASMDEREAAATACEALLAALRARPGEPLAPPAPPTAFAAAQSLAATSSTAFLDALIQKLEGYLPESERGEVRRSAGLRIPMVHIPTSRKR